MIDIPPVHTLGRRIMVLGLSNAGKSTLTVALSAQLGIPAVHLDQLQHLPNTDWEVRPEAGFAALHDEAIAASAWIVDGSYSRLMPQRLARATGIIVLTDSLATRYRRYINRTLFHKQRVGGLVGGQDRINWTMIHWLWHTRKSAGKYQDIARASGLPYVSISGRHELDALYGKWELNAPWA